MSRGFYAAGVVSLLVGAWLWLRTAASSHLCSYGLVYALVPQRCESIEIAHVAGAVTVVASIAALAATRWRDRKNTKAREG